MAFGPWNPEGAAHQGEQQLHGMRASHTDRERAIDVLKAGFSEGRMGQEEYEQRLSRASSAQTYGELNVLLADLPQGPVPMPRPAAPAPVPGHPYAPVPRTFLPPPSRTNGAAIGSLVCGVLTPMYGVTAIPAVILGHVAKSQIKRTGEDGSGLATGGLVLGWLAIGAVMLFIFAVVVANV